MSFKRFIFLYSELPPYMLPCFRELINLGFEIKIIHWPINNNAPFESFNSSEFQLINKQSLRRNDLARIVDDFQPSGIYVSGWIDHDYLSLVRNYRSTIPIIMALDNPWIGSLKQKIFALPLRFLLKFFFTHVWCSGSSQVAYAKKLGFSEDKILKNLYVADLVFFDKIFSQKKWQSTPNFYFQGRYVEEKGIKFLVETYIEWQKKANSPWGLICLGTGPLMETLPKHGKVIHLGFKQPHELEEILTQKGVFILPSNYEPWGVVIQEYAAAGFPLIASDKVCARELFLEEDVNGNVFKAGDKFGLFELLSKYSTMNESSFRKMASHSNKLSKQLTPVTWAYKLNKLILEHVRP